MILIHIIKHRYIFFGLRLGDDKYWSALHEITIGDYEEPEDIQSPQIMGVSS